MSSCRYEPGDLVVIDMPGTTFEGVHALVLRQLVRPYIDGTMVESDVELLALGCTMPMMFRAKWLKIISKNKKKDLTNKK
tara:strand:+ start:300 stop:539 length:240 start_codon:yes stop_codon:yes gene_type:complete